MRKFKVVIGVMVLSLLALAETPKGPTSDEKLAISQLVRQYLQAKQTALDAQIKASTLVQQIQIKQNEVESKYGCSYNFDTDECVMKEKK